MKEGERDVRNWEKNLWVLRKTMNDYILEKETKELENEFSRVRELIFDILHKHPAGIKEDAFFDELPENEDHEKVGIILSFLIIEQSVQRTADGYQS